MSAQWTVPIVLGLLAAGITWYAPDDIHVPRAQALDIRTDSPYVLLPWADHDATLLRYNATDARHGLGGILDVHAGLVENGTFWRRGGWECVRDPPCEGHAVAIDLGAAIQDRRGAREAGEGTTGNSTVPTLGPDYPTAHITFYMFTSSGHLLATSAPRSHWDTYDLHGDFTAFSQTLWHLGAGPAPPGAGKVPMREEAYAVLEGTPVGGVQSAVLERHQYDWLVGPVWMTARVEGLSAAADPRAP